MMRTFIFIICTSWCIAASAGKARAARTRVLALSKSKQHTKLSVGDVAYDFAVAHELANTTHCLQEPTTTKSYESFGEAMSNAFANFIGGIILITFSIPILWVNERRNARMQSLLSRSRGDVLSVSSAKPSPDNRGKLVHLSDGETKACMAVSSKWFPSVSMQSGCVRLSTCVEVYQWVQHEQKQEKDDRVGGGKTTTVTYTYDKSWQSIQINSDSFQDKSHRNTCPSGLGVGTDVATCGDVQYGEGFVLPINLVTQLDNFQSANSFVGDNVSTGNVKFMLGTSDQRYYHPEPRSPQIGDARVTFEYIPDGPATIIALQAEHIEIRDSFKPYRLFSRGLCGMREDEEKRKALQEADRTASDLAGDDMLASGPLACLCCACNLVTCFMSGVLTPEVYHTFGGSRLSPEECIRTIGERNTKMTWVCRVIGWIMMFAGSYALFSPLTTFVKIIPFLGTYLSSLVGWVLWLTCFLFTLAMSALIIMLAYLTYHPLFSLMWGAVVVGIIVMITQISKISGAKEA